MCFDYLIDCSFCSDTKVYIAINKEWEIQKLSKIRALIGIDTNMPDPDVVSFTVDVLSYIIGDMS